MRLSPDIAKQLDTIVLLFLLALFLLASPFITWWATEERPWYIPYLIWLAIIMLAAWLQIRRAQDDL